MKLHERLRELRSERGLRLKDVAETAGISVPYLSDLEREYDARLRARMVLYHYASAADGEAMTWSSEPTMPPKL